MLMDSSSVSPAANLQLKVTANDRLLPDAQLLLPLALTYPEVAAKSTSTEVAVDVMVFAVILPLETVAPVGLIQV